MSYLRKLVASPRFWIAAAVAGRHLIGAGHLRRNLAWLAKGQAPTVTPLGTPPVIHFVIPVLGEAEHIEPALSWFGDLLTQLPGSTLTFATTAREQRERDALVQQLAGSPARSINRRAFPGLSTEQIGWLRNAARTAGGVLSNEDADKFASSGPLTPDVVAQVARTAQARGHAVYHTHYDGEGRKAAQVNHAVSCLPAPGLTDYVAVYDIDSRPTLDLFERTTTLIAERMRLDGQPPHVVQQSARFAVPNRAPSGWQTTLCRGAAQAQTLWTLRREITSFRRYAGAVRSPAGVRTLDAVRRGLAQTVGHGLFIRLDVFAQVGGLPETTLLDDLPFGYRLTAAGIPVDCVAATALADAPHELAELISQGKRWFHNYLDYPRVAAEARAAGHGTVAEHAIALAVAAYRGTTWLTVSPLTAAATAVLIAPKTRLPVRLLAAAGLWAGVVTPLHAVAKAEGRSLSTSETVTEAAALYAAYLLCSAGPLAALASKLACRESGLSPSPKTTQRITKEN